MTTVVECRAHVDCVQARLQFHLRLVVRDMSTTIARDLLGTRVRAVGNYQMDKNGKPRLLFVERFEAAPAPIQNPLV